MPLGLTPFGEVLPSTMCSGVYGCNTYGRDDSHTRPVGDIASGRIVETSDLGKIVLTLGRCNLGEEDHCHILLSWIAKLIPLVA